MGECGCGDGFRLPGPDGSVYTFDIYCGCSGCDNAAGITLHRYSKEDVEGDFCCVKDIPELPWQMLGDYGMFAAPLVDPGKLAGDLALAFGDVECTFGGEATTLAELFDVERDALWGLIAAHISRVFGAWLDELRERRAGGKDGN